MAVLVLGCAALFAVCMLVNAEGRNTVRVDTGDKFWSPDVSDVSSTEQVSMAAAKKTSTLEEIGQDEKSFDIDEFLKSLFIDVTSSFNPDKNCEILDKKYYEKGCPFLWTGMLHVLMLLVAYGFVLYQASVLISDGSELLLCVDGYKKIVGTVVLPVLGAVPDGMIVLFSGLGPAEKVQQALSVGVGAIAGSTIMLLTIPWAVAIFAGRVSICNIQPGGYKCKLKLDESGKLVQNKLDPPGNRDLYETGVGCDSSIAMTGKIMMITAVPYVIIQGSAFVAKCGTTEQVQMGKCNSGSEQLFALLGLIYCVLCFFGYLYYQVKTDDGDAVLQDKSVQMHIINIEKKNYTLGMIINTEEKRQKIAKFINPKTQGEVAEDSDLRTIVDVVEYFFNKYDEQPRDKFIDVTELTHLLSDLGSGSTISAKTTAEQVMKDESIAGKDGKLSFQELLKALADKKIFSKKDFEGKITTPRNTITDEDLEAFKNQDHDEEPEVPEDLEDLSPEEQQSAIKKRSFMMMAIGTVLVLLFSDPMVDVLGAFGNAVGMGPFYASFILAPIASNASEILSAYSYSLKKTSKSITISFSALQGAACMNNSFCLGIFLALMYFKRLTWEFSAETLSILAVEILLAVMSMKQIHRLRDAAIVLAAFPLSLVFVAVLEKVVGFD
jgi:Ca2+/H+ antiporter